MSDENKQGGAAGDTPQGRVKTGNPAVANHDDLQPTWKDKDGREHKKRILTGDRTTGKLHLGHYVGSLKNRVKLQRLYDTFILMADVQALTTHWENPKILRESVREVALDYLAAGLEPYTGGPDDGSRAKIVIQSHVAAIAELTCFYGLITPMSTILDNPTTKAEAQQYGMGGDENRDTGEMRDESFLAGVKDRLLLDYPELGSDTTLHNINEAISAALNTTDVSLRKLLDDMGGDAEHAIKELPSFRKEIREQLIRLKRTAGLRQMTYGFLGYPVSQAADITFVNAHLVPVGEDQLPHIELTRDIVQRFNKQYGKRRRILTVPQALLGGTGTLKGLDGRKMSKSLGNAVYLSDSDKDIWQKLKPAPTDPQRVRKDDPGRPEVCTIFSYHQAFNGETETSIDEQALGCAMVPEVAENCRGAKWGCVECKQQLAKKLSALLTPMRERRSHWESHEGDLYDVLKAGTARGNEEGNATVERVKDAMHVDYWPKQ